MTTPRPKPDYVLTCPVCKRRFYRTDSSNDMLSHSVRDRYGNLVLQRCPGSDRLVPCRRVKHRN